MELELGSAYLAQGWLGAPFPLYEVLYESMGFHATIANAPIQHFGKLLSPRYICKFMVTAVPTTPKCILNDVFLLKKLLGSAHVLKHVQQACPTNKEPFLAPVLFNLKICCSKFLALIFWLIDQARAQVTCIFPPHHWGVSHVTYPNAEIGFPTPHKTINLGGTSIPMNF